MQLKKWMAAAAAGALLSTGAMADKLKVGFVYVGPVSDGGWTYEHDVGRKAVEAEYGDKVETTYVESVSEGPDAERVITQLAQQNDMVFTTSFGYMNPTVKVAKRFPNVKFEHATGFKRADNVAVYSSRFYEGRHVIGLIAGEMTKSNTIGYIASFPIPEVIRGINAAYLAAKSVNPDVKMKIVWVNTWFDPGKESDAANALIDQGVDVMFQHTDSPAPIQTAERRGIYSVGYASDMAHFGPKAVLTSIVNDWGPHYVKSTQAVIDGTWQPQDFWGGLAEDTIELPISDLVPADVKGEAEQIIADIRSGKFHPFTGPIKDQSGAVRIAEGVSATNAELASMNYYVENVKAEMPK